MLLEKLIPIFSFERNKLQEVVVYGAFHFKKQGHEINGCQAFEFATRDQLKPWQMLACESYGDEKFWALTLSSHCSSEEQLLALMEYVEKVGADKDDLICPRYSCEGYNLELTNGQIVSPSRLLHPCSGKHLLMLAESKKLGVSGQNYWENHHPVQKKIFTYVAQLVRKPIRWVTDDCGVPTAVMSSYDFLNMWESLVNSHDPKCKNLIKMWIDCSKLIGGKKIEADLMKISEGKLIAKSDENGVFILQTVDPEQLSQAGCFLKLANGSSYGHYALALLSILSQQSNLPPVLIKVLEYLQNNSGKWVPKTFDYSPASLEMIVSV